MESYKVSQDLIEKWYQGLRDENINNQIKIYNYRPFDNRFVIYDPKILQRARKEIMDNFFNDNLAIATPKNSKQDNFNEVFIADSFTDKHLIGHQTFVFPLFIYQNNNENVLFGKTGVKQINFSSEFWKELKGSFVETLDPWTIFNYIYAVLYSNVYREKYSEFLKIDFPKIPFTKDVELFYKVAKMGKELVDLHLLKSQKLEKSIVKFPKSDGCEVKKVKYDEKSERIYINDVQYFEKIKPEIWNYYIGGYQVLNKWLKDRTDRHLSDDDIEHLLKIISALHYTIELQKEIDKLYPEVEKDLIN